MKPTTADSYHHMLSPIDSEGNVRCYRHFEVARERTSKTVTNPGRVFYVCSRENFDEPCDFFKWKDDLPPPKTPVAPLFAARQTTLGGSPSQALRAQMAAGTVVPTSPTKRARSVTPPSTPQRAGPSAVRAGTTPSGTKTPAAKKANWVQAIQAELAPQPEPTGGASPSKRPRFDGTDAEEVEGMLGPSTQSSGVSMYDVGLQAAPPSSQDMFWGEPTVNPETYRLASLPPPDLREGPSALGSTPVRRVDGVFPTPPKTERGQREEQVAYREGYAEPETPTRSKGKGRADAGALAPSGVEADGELPYEIPAEAELRTPTRNMANSGSVSVDAVEAAAAVLASVPDRMRSLEQRVANLTRGIQARDQRIGEKDAELEKLKEKITELENYNRLLRLENDSLRK